MTPEEVRKFCNECKRKLSEKGDVTFRAQTDGDKYLLIRTEHGYAVHYEWWIDRNNLIKVCLHFEVKNNPKLNKEYYDTCMAKIGYPPNDLIQGIQIQHGIRGKAKNWRHITIQRPLSADVVSDTDVAWAVKMMQLLRKTFGDTFIK